MLERMLECESHCFLLPETSGGICQNEPPVALMPRQSDAVLSASD
jgi:hypothetical protein